MNKLGVSAYISNLDDFKYLEKARKDGVTRVFISLHIPEEIGQDFIDKATLLINKIKALGFKHVICDISKLGINALGMTVNNLDWIYKEGIECRLDYGFTKKEIAELSKKYKIWINASTASQEILEELSKRGNIKNVSASHDFYPLIGSGLSPEQVLCQDSLLRKYKINKIISFIAGTKKFRGPMNDGLPTLENTRGENPATAHDKLINLYMHKYVYIGDPDYFRLKKTSNTNTEIKDVEQVLKKTKYELRISDSLFRFKGTRIMSHSESGKTDGTIKRVKPIKCNIQKGDIVILNSNSKRYEGEVAIIASDLPKKKWSLFNKVGELINPNIDIPKLRETKVIRIKRA